ncbi:hypothetical protein JNW88_22210 [Micromonospora sp. ATA32]|nr:hypothetical protein [Micromonospora sp. ATA32]
MLAIAVPGAALAVARFDLLLLSWLSVLAATLPPLIIPMATEAWRRGVASVRDRCRSGPGFPPAFWRRR